jgi:hypothetical protein
MRITSTASALSLAIQALDKGLLPNISNAEAVGTIGLIRTTLLDLLKRQVSTAPVLLEIITKGEFLEREIQAHLDASTTYSSALTGYSAHFDPLAEVYDQLTTRLNKQAEHLATRTGTDSQAATLLRRLAEWEAEYYAAILKIQVAPWNDNPSTVPSNFDAQAKPLTMEALQSFLRESRGRAVEVMSFDASLEDSAKKPSAA